MWEQMKQYIQTHGYWPTGRMESIAIAEEQVKKGVLRDVHELTNKVRPKEFYVWANVTAVHLLPFNLYNLLFNVSRKPEPEDIVQIKVIIGGSQVFLPATIGSIKGQKIEVLVNNTCCYLNQDDIILPTHLSW